MSRERAPPRSFHASTQYVWNEHVHMTGRSRSRDVVYRYMFVRIQTGNYDTLELLRIMIRAIDQRTAMITHRADWPWYGGIYWICAFYHYETGDGNINEIYARFREEMYDTYRAWQRTGYGYNAGPPQHFQPQRRQQNHGQGYIQPYQGVYQPQRPSRGYQAYQHDENFRHDPRSGGRYPRGYGRDRY